MDNLNTIYLFLFIFSVLTVIRTVVRFISALLQNPPSQLKLTRWELIYLGITLSYTITYIIKY